MMTSPSLSPIIIAVSDAPDLITILPKNCENPPNTVPPSLNLISPPSTSILKSPPISKSKSPASVIVEPLIVISSTVNEVRVPRLVIPLCAASTDISCTIPSPEVAPVEVRPVPAVTVPT